MNMWQLHQSKFSALRKTNTIFQQLKKKKKSVLSISLKYTVLSNENHISVPQSHNLYFQELFNLKSSIKQTKTN